MSCTEFNMLVTTDWLAAHLDDRYLRVIDATLFLPDAGRNARDEFETAHIPGAVFMDLDDIADKNTALPHMLPSAEKFASRMQALGLGDGCRFVIYDNSPLKSSARAWWMFNLFGAHQTAILDGGLAKWRAEGRPVESGRPTIRHRHFTPWADMRAVRTLADMRENLQSKKEQILDARPANRFSGTAPEPRPNLRGGHMPGAHNLPHDQLFNADGTWKTGQDLEAAFQASGIDLDQPIVTSCGSGITAATLVFGLRLLDRENVSLYDGSWAEWGACKDTPVVTGAPS